MAFRFVAGLKLAFKSLTYDFFPKRTEEIPAIDVTEALERFEKDHNRFHEDDAKLDVDNVIVDVLVEITDLERAEGGLHTISELDTIIEKGVLRIFKKITNDIDSIKKLYDRNEIYVGIHAQLGALKEQLKEYTHEFKKMSRKEIHEELKKNHDITFRAALYKFMEVRHTIREMYTEEHEMDNEEHKVLHEVHDLMKAVKEDTRDKHDLLEKLKADFHLYQVQLEKFVKDLYYVTLMVYILRDKILKDEGVLKVEITKLKNDGFPREELDTFNESLHGLHSEIQSHLNREYDEQRYLEHQLS